MLMKSLSSTASQPLRFDCRTNLIGVKEEDEPGNFLGKESIGLILAEGYVEADGQMEALVLGLLSCVFLWEQLIFKEKQF
jgi:hypothetical protein